jgi:hypothetical protein
MKNTSNKSIIKKNSYDDEEIILQKMMLKEMRQKISEMISNNDPSIFKTLKLLISQDEPKNNK